MNFQWDGNGLALYASMNQFFGPDRFRDYVRSDQYNTLFNRGDPYLGRRGSQLLRASKIMGKDLRYHFNFHGFNDTQLNNFNSSMRAFKLLDEMNLPKFHPIATIYGTGYKLENDYIFESARPFKIPPTTYRLDFVKTKVQRANTKWFGDHVFSGITPVNGTFKEVNKTAGLYDLEPNEDPTVIDECIAHYLDKTTGLTTGIICKFEQTPYKANYARYTNLGSKKDLFDAYNATINMNLKPAQTNMIDKFDSGKISGDNTGWLAIIDADFHVEETGEYEFSIIKADDAAAIYLSEEGKKLSLDPDDDASQLILFTKKYSTSWNDVEISKPVKLAAGKKYHIALVNYNAIKQGPGEAHPGIRKVGGAFGYIGQKFIIKGGVSYEKIYRSQFKPNFFEIPFMNIYEEDMIQAKSGKWNVYIHSGGRFTAGTGSGSEGWIDNSRTVTDALTDGNPNTEFRANWWYGTGYSSFPHIFEIDMGEDTIFDCIKIGGTQNRNWFDMNSTMEIRVADGNFRLIADENGTFPFDPNNVSLYNAESTIYFGNYVTTSPYFQLNETRHGRYLKIIFYDNNKMWKDNNKGRSSISEVTVGKRRIPPSMVIPSTSSLFKYSGDWRTNTDGYYYNGKAATGKAGSVLKYNVSTEFLAISGTRWEQRPSSLMESSRRRSTRI